VGITLGEFNWVDHTNGCHINGPVTPNSLVICGIHATFTGTCKNLNECTTYTVKVTDNGEPGKNDTISVTIVGGSCNGNGTTPPNEQQILRGNIQIHK
jgi:hypothetical protein